MDERQHIRIDQYLSSEMTVEEQQAFEQEIEADGKLAQEVALQREIEAAFQEPEVEDLEAKLAAVMRAEGEGKVRSLRASWVPWAVAASVVLILGVGYLLRGNGQDSRTPEELYLAYAELPAELKSESSIRSGPAQGGSDSVSNVWQQVDSLYQAAAYDQALVRLATWSTQHPEPTPSQASTYHYCLGMIQLQMGEFAEARISLEQVRGGPNAEAAHWYRTLIRLRQEGPTDAVKKQVEDFAKFENSLYRDLAQELLGEIK
ncbi:MAG: hypothetical protein AAF399_18385 [Bacteroidota bacterium]